MLLMDFNGRHACNRSQQSLLFALLWDYFLKSFPVKHKKTCVLVYISEKLLLLILRCSIPTRPFQVQSLSVATGVFFWKLLKTITFDKCLDSLRFRKTSQHFKSYVKDTLFLLKRKLSFTRIYRKQNWIFNLVVMKTFIR